MLEIVFQYIIVEFGGYMQKIELKLNCLQWDRLMAVVLLKIINFSTPK